MRKIIHYVKRFIMFCWIQVSKVVYKIVRKRNKEIIKLKNKYYGERVFIVATGPSLTFDDLELIENEYSISMNSIVKSFDKTTYRPSFYIIQDDRVIKDNYEFINNSNLKNIFIGRGNSFFLKANVDKKDILLLNKKDSSYTFWLNSNYHYYEMCYKPQKAKFKFSTDFSKESFDGYTVAYSAIQLAVYLGFKKIYLLGCDCTYGGHFGDVASNSSKDLPPYFFSYEKAKEYANEHDIEIINCTRGGMLEVFERKKLEEVIQDGKRS